MGSGVWSLSRSTRKGGGGAGVGEGGDGPGRRGRRRLDPETRAPVLCLDVEDTGTLGWVLTGVRLPEPRGAPSSGRLQRSPALRVYCLSIATPALKAARPPLREGAETEGRGGTRRGGGCGCRATTQRKVVFPSR